LQDQSFVLQKFNITAPIENLPGSQGGDENGEELTGAVEQVVDQVTDKFESSNLELSKVTDEFYRLQQGVSEKSALLSHYQRSLASKHAQMSQLSGENGSVDKIRRVIGKVKQYESDIGVSTPYIDESDPQGLFAYMGKRLEEEEAESTEGIQPETIKKVLTRLKKQVCVISVLQRFIGCFLMYCKELTPKVFSFSRSVCRAKQARVLLRAHAVPESLIQSKSWETSKIKYNYC
jgi:hypothetical protein